MISRIIYFLILVALFVLYCIRFHEKSMLFFLGVGWFSLDSIRALLSIIFWDKFFNEVNHQTALYLNEILLRQSVCVSWLRIIECVLLFFFVFCFYRSRKKKIKLAH